MKEYTKNFIHALSACALPKDTITAITEMLWEQREKMVMLLDFIEEKFETVTEQEIIEKAYELAKA